MKTITYYKFRDLSKEAKKVALQWACKNLEGSGHFGLSDKEITKSIIVCSYDFKKSGRFWNE